MKQIIILNNFKLLNQILDKDFGVIECSCISNPNSEVFNQPLKNQIYELLNKMANSPREKQSLHF